MPESSKIDTKGQSLRPTDLVNQCCVNWLSWLAVSKPANYKALDGASEILPKSGSIEVTMARVPESNCTAVQVWLQTSESLFLEFRSEDFLTKDCKYSSCLFGMAEDPNRVLMCPPDYFAVKYEINPWMNVRVAVDHNLARQQWLSLYHTIAQICPNIALITPRPTLPDLVFCDAGFLYKNVFIPSCFRYPEQRPEAEVFANWFAQNGYEIRRIAPTYYFEGHGDNLWVDENAVYCGYGFRSQKRSFEHIRNCLADVGDINMKLVCLTDPRFYHLDTCFTPLNRNLALIYKPAVDDDSFNMLAQDFELLTVTEADALAFACNTVVLGKHLIMPAASPALQETLRAKGFQVHIVSVSEFMKAGGACKCLAMPL